MNTLVISDIRAQEIMTCDLFTAYEGWTIHRLADFFIHRNISAVPVIASDHELVGVVSVDDVCRFNNLNEQDKSTALRNHYRDSCGQDINEEVLRSWVKDAAKNCTVHQIMTHEVIAIDQSESVKVVANLLLDRHLHRVFVTDNNKVVGVITVMDVLRAFIHPPR